MGCSTCRSNSSTSTEILSRIKLSIEQDNSSGLDSLIKFLSFHYKLEMPILVNKPLNKIENFYCNLLSYALFQGKAKVFNYLIKTLNCSTYEMEELFIEAKQDPMAILCQRGHINIIKIYLPVYLQSFEKRKLVLKEKSMTISFSNHPAAHTSQSTFTPAHLACINGHISIIHYFNEFFSNIVPPSCLDIHYKDEMTGENCALLAVRTGNFAMIKVLHESAKANFHIKNNYKEGALQILAASAKLNSSLRFIDCMMYLVDIIKIDITYMHEETLLLLECKVMLKFLELKLKALGINTTKKELESMFKIKLYKRIEDQKQNSNIVGDTEEISRIVPDQGVSNFDASNQSCLLDI